MTILEPVLSRPFRLINAMQDLPEGLYFKDGAVQLLACEGHP
jgi:hypothetical protein